MLPSRRHTNIFCKNIFTVSDMNITIFVYFFGTITTAQTRLEMFFRFHGMAGKHRGPVRNSVELEKAKDLSRICTAKTCAKCEKFHYFHASGMPYCTIILQIPYCCPTQRIYNTGFWISFYCILAISKS